MAESVTETGINDVVSQGQPKDTKEVKESNPVEREDQSLESHEVIELQTFSERKAWIEEKIKFLESLPIIDVFHGLDYIRDSVEEIPGLPTRAELKAMVAEHDVIEKETEIFDTGELKKLRQLTKAATQRNLSPADTDVIELTLTTIYELDKLLHLLRDRSDNLEMMNMRLTWEENRRAGWKERRQIIEDLHAFASNRARWSPEIYDVSLRTEDSSSGTHRRGSVASLASTGSSDSVINSPAFSRSARFKLSELLSRDAAQFTGRVTSLKHGTVNAAGKALDRLIDHSRKPVPDELLDEQDRFEEKCINELEGIGKFTMGLVMQWRKADEIYIETTKDYVSASNLLEEIETAQMYHPTARQSTLFISRIDTILKRLAVRGDPSSPVSLFPRPEHFLFPDQKEANNSLVLRLSTDISAANELARKVSNSAKNYRSRYEAVKGVETVVQSANELISSLVAINKKYCEGIPGGDGDESPPNLTSEYSLEPMSHNVFLALLPSLLEETKVTVDGADELLRSAASSLLSLNLPGIDQQFKENSAATFRELSVLRNEAISLRDSVSQRTIRLRESRKIAASIDSKLAHLKTIRVDILRAMERHRWHQESGDTSTPPTPESPISELHIPCSMSVGFEDQLAKLTSSLDTDIVEPLDKLSVTLEAQVQSVLRQRLSDLQVSVDSSHQMLRLLESIKDQTAVMSSVRDSFHKLSLQIEDARIHCSALIDAILIPHSDCTADDIMEFGMEEFESIRKEVNTFVDDLSSRIPFIARLSRVSKRSTLMSPILPMSNEANSPVDIWSEISFDSASVDAAVRADSNSFAIRINGNLENLQQTMTHLSLTRLAKRVDNALSSTLHDINSLVQELSALTESFVNVKRHSLEAIDRLETVLDGLDTSRARRSSIARSLSPIRELLRRMDEMSRPLPSFVRESLYQSRLSATDDVELRLNSWYDQIDIRKHEVRHALEDEHRYQEELMAAEEWRKKEQEERYVLEEVERLRLQMERLNEQQRLQRLEEKRAEEERREQERQRIEAESADKQRLERELAEAEQLRRQEEERQAEISRIKFEQERLEKEESEKALRDQERQLIFERLNLVEEKLEEERKMHAENERIAKDLAEKQKAEMDKLAQRQAEMEKAEKERLEQEEKKRLEWEQREHAKPRQEESGGLEKKGKKSRVRETKLSPAHQDAEDVFIVPRTPSGSRAPQSQDLVELQSQIIQLRRRLKSIGIKEAFRPSKPSADLPTEEQLELMILDFKSVSLDAQHLPSKVDDALIDVELQSFKTEVKESSGMLKDLQKLVDLQKSIQACDGALSDLLEHIDSFPAPPLGVLASSHRTQPGAPPEEQLSARLEFTKQIVDDMASKVKIVAEDPRATTEHDRVQQTWSELNEMAVERLAGRKSRSPSLASGHSSGRNSTASGRPVQTHARSRKAGSYSNLSVSSIILPSRPKTLAPPTQSVSRRAVSGSRETPSRSTSRISAVTTTNRSVSGPSRNSLHSPTFASRQRTTSLSNSTSTARTPTLAPAVRIRLDSQQRQSNSPTISEMSTNLQARSFSRATRAPSRSSVNTSTWARAPRNSLSSIIQRNITPQKKTSQPPPRKKYVADPKSKLDVAVGDVVNKLPVGINVEGVTESWRDQSGKYWIGNEDPKLCFCRILRSQTVMVRVGGGWTELSKFIKNHFADSFRILPESPPRAGGQEVKWISSAILLESSENGTPPRAPRTPEPTVPFVPTFSLLTPGGQSPRSLKSSPSTRGSPLTPMQFIRRAEPDISLLRPATPSKPHRSKLPSSPNTPVWRP